MMTRATNPDPFAMELGGAVRSEVVRKMNARKWIWMALLMAGFWFARPYYLPWTAAEEADADTRATAAQGSVERQVAMPLLSLLAVYMLWRSPTARKFKGKLMVVTVVYCAVQGASIAWSVDPLTTLRRLTVFYMLVVVAIAMARALTVMDLMKLAFFGCGACAAISFLVDLVITRSFAPLDPEYRLMGVMSSNSQGQNITVCVFAGLALLMKYPHWRRWMVPTLAFMMVLLYVTRSRTSTFLCVVLGLFFVKRILDERFGKSKRMVVGFTVGGVLAAALITFGSAQSAQNAAMLGRNDTQNNASLSNRAPLWQEMDEYMQVRPILGYGYAAFWTSDRIKRISRDQGWGVPNAHNTYIDQHLSTGWPGVVLFVAMYWAGVVMAWARYIKQRNAETLLPAAMLTWLLLTSMAESVPPDPFLPTFLVYVFLTQLMLEQPPEKECLQVVRRPTRRVVTHTRALPNPEMLPRG